MKKLHLYIDEELAKYKSKSDQEIVQAIADAFDRLEQEWIKVAQISFHNGFAKAAYVGSCAIVSIVYNNKLYISNAGDSKATLLRISEDGKSFQRVKASKTFNANKKYEQERLKDLFKNE